MANASGPQERQCEEREGGKEQDHCGMDWTFVEQANDPLDEDWPLQISLACGGIGAGYFFTLTYDSNGRIRAGRAFTCEWGGQ